MKPNRFQQALATRGHALGTMLMEFGTRGMARIVASTPVDFVMLDMEHTGFDTGQIADLIAWFKATDVAPFVRVPQDLYHFCARTLDAGALGLMFANVESGEQARAIVAASKYAPMGRRGVALGTAHSDFLVPPAADYYAMANANTTLIAMIESPKGLTALDEIAGTPGIDVLWVGHYDLTTNMGIPAQFDHPDFLAALAAVVEAARRHGKVAGIQPYGADQARAWHAQGFRVLSWGMDIAIYRQALAAGVDTLRELCGPPAESLRTSGPRHH